MNTYITLVLIGIAVYLISAVAAIIWKVLCYLVDTIYSLLKYNEKQTNNLS